MSQQAAALSPGGYVRQGQRGTSPPRSVNVQVAVRCRPLNDRERSHAERPILTCNEDRREVVFNANGPAQRKPVTSNSAPSASSSANGKRTFTYDHVFDQDASQADVYNRLVQPIVDEVLQGYNCTVFAYGQTGTGKTHTMEGRRHDDVMTPEDRRLPDNAGIIPRAIQQVFDHLRSLTDEHSVRVSHLELYNEQLTDLLSPEDMELRVYEDQHKGTFVQGLEDTVVRTEQEIFAVLDKSAMKRKTAETNMNKFSSRSHSIFSITIHIKESTPDGADLLKVGKLNLVDLAGSENVGRSGAVKGRAREAGNINQSLLTLGRVITALVDRHPHIPYRDSKLTRLLQESLGGRNKTCIIATVTPASGSLEETVSTLDYAYRAKSIKNRPTVNQMIAKHVLLKEYTEEIAKLKRELDATREKNGVYLPPEEFERLQRMNNTQSSQITDLETQAEEYEKRVTSLKTKLDRTQSALERDQRILNDTRTNLTRVTNELDVTKEQLAVTKLQRDDNSALVHEHVTTERALRTQGMQLQRTLTTSLADVNALHTRVDVKTQLEKENIAVLAQLQKDISVHSENVRKKLDAHVIEHRTRADSACSSVGAAQSRVYDAFNSIKQCLTDMQDKLSKREETDAVAADSENVNLENAMTETRLKSNAALSVYNAARREQHESLTETCNKVCALFAQALSAMDEMNATSKTYSTGVGEALDALQNAQGDALETLEEEICEFVRMQKEIVTKLISVGKRENEVQVDALRATRAQILDRVTAVMDGLISDSVARHEDRVKSEQSLFDSLLAHGTDAQARVNNTKSSLVSKVSDCVTKCTDQGIQLSDRLQASRKRADETIAQVGIQAMSECKTTSEQLTVQTREMNTECTSHLDSIVTMAHSTRQNHATQRATQREGRDEIVQHAVSQVSSTETEAMKEAQQLHDNVKETVQSACEEVDTTAHDVSTHITEHVTRRIDEIKLCVDTEADKVPMRREWPVLTQLARTRNHTSLITEAREKRNVTASRTEVPVEDFGHDVPRTPEKTRLKKDDDDDEDEDEDEDEEGKNDVDVTKEHTESTETGSEETDGIKTEDTNENISSCGSKDESNSTIEIEQSYSLRRRGNEEVNEPSGGWTTRRGAIKKRKNEDKDKDKEDEMSNSANEAIDAFGGGASSDSSTPTATNTATATRAQDDLVVKPGGGNVLTDVSNRRTAVRSKSMRRIKPVIKKGSAIPVPRTRTTRNRLHQQQQQPNLE